MATLQTIRTKAGVLISVVIGIALLAFILTDLLSSGGSLFQNRQMEVAEVDGESIQYPEYQQLVSEKTDFYELQMGRALSAMDFEQIRNEAWQELIRLKVLEMENSTLGVDVSPAELKDLILGDNPDPMVRQIFTDPNTGQLNKPQLENFLRNFNQVQGENRTFWLYIENQIYKNRLIEKYNTLISKGIFVTSLEVENDNFERAHQVDFNYVLNSYSRIADSEIQITEDDVSDYYNENEHRFEQDASRDIKYVTFEIDPSDKDKAADKNAITELIDEFKTTDEALQFIRLNADNPQMPKFVKPEDITYAELDSFVIKEALEGDVFGPYIEDESYKLAKVVEFAQRPDTVRARHILFRVDQNSPYKTIEQAEAVADSIYNILLADSTQFTALAGAYGMDGTNTKGGDLGWFEDGNMVQPFNDSSFVAPVGKIMKVNTQFGVHILQVTGRGEETLKVKIAYLDRAMSPSKETRDRIFAVANRFAGENQTLEEFEKSAEKIGLTVKAADKLNDMDRNIPGLESPRELVKWAFEANTGDVSQVFEFGDDFVVSILTNINEEGVAPLKQVKGQIAAILLKEKKAEKLTAKFNEVSQGASSLSEIAAKTDTAVVTASAVNFNSFQVPGAGSDGEVIGYAVTMPKDKISEPIASNTGVFVIKVTSITPPSNEVNVDINRERLARTIQARVAGNRYMDGAAYRALKEKADVKDHRAKFE